MSKSRKLFLPWGTKYDVLVVNCFVCFWIIYFCFVVVICDLVHAVVATHVKC